MCHSDAKITEKLEKRHMARAPHRPYPLDLSPRDFWLFGILKQKMKERVFSEWRTNFGRYHRELEWAHIQGHPESFP
jgi:hypothetical protein